MSAWTSRNYPIDHTPRRIEALASPESTDRPIVDIKVAEHIEQIAVLIRPRHRRA